MKEIVATLLTVAVLSAAASEEQEGRHALFVRAPSAAAHSRAQRAAPVSAADLMAQNILEWIQGIYRQGARKTRQQTDPPGYLPPYSTRRPPERPRPFQAPSTSQQPTYTSPAPAQNEVTDNYPYQRPSTGFSSSNVALPSGQSSTVLPPSFSSTQRSTYLPPKGQSSYGPSSYNPRPTQTTSNSNFGSSVFPPYSSTSRPVSTSQAPQSGYSTSGGVSNNYGYSTSSFIEAGASAGASASASANANANANANAGASADGDADAADAVSNNGQFSTPSGFSSTYGYSTQKPSTAYIPLAEGSVSSGSSGAGYPSPGGFTTYGYSTSKPNPPFHTPGTVDDSYEQNSGAAYPSSHPEDTGKGSSGTDITIPSETSGGTADGTAGSTGQGSTGFGTVTGNEVTQDGDDDLKHPPHIHALDVQCSKTMMTINIEFNRVFEGVIYSKGYYTNPECRYVSQNSGRTKYSFTVSLNSCGTQFINDFAGEAGQAYLENVLVLQNEPGIQEVWDTVRRVRCLWEGNINKALSVNFSVDMLNQEIVTFSGDTAVARLDIQVGRGPFAPAADGLVKIGETMTLVVSVEGDPAFDLQVRDCLARDESSTNVIQLTDERGCILKPKLFGAFQKTKNTGNTGASIIAYAYFQAFKFPDVMDLFIECNVELCKTNCEPCHEINQQIEPGRRRRSIDYAPFNDTLAMLLSEPVRVARGFRVVMVDDLSKASNQVLEHLEETAVEEIVRTTTNVCMTYSGFYTAIFFLLSTIFVSTISAVVLYVKLQRVYRSKSVYS